MEAAASAKRHGDSSNSGDMADGETEVSDLLRTKGSDPVGTTFVYNSPLKRLGRWSRGSASSVSAKVNC